jgi:hypothetical protein
MASTASDGEIVEGDWIGLSRDELIRHGKTLTEFLRNISGQRRH